MARRNPLNPGFALGDTFVLTGDDLNELILMAEYGAENVVYGEAILERIVRSLEEQVGQDKAEVRQIV